VPSAAPPGILDGVPLRPARTRRPRLLPAALAASAVVVLSAGGVLVATGGSDAPTADACASGSEFVTVQPVFDDTAWKPVRAAGPTLAGCVDSDRLDRATSPTPTNPRG
jgi:hypothetical protein